jgi:hypothetical protein
MYLSKVHALGNVTLSPRLLLDGENCIRRQRRAAIDQVAHELCIDERNTVSGERLMAILNKTPLEEDASNPIAVRRMLLNL